jgi:AbiV family abortive infection protein
MEADEILYGAYCAMEQSGRLLADSATLCRQQRWSSSLALAVFSIEELGKAKILLKKATEANQTGPKPINELMRGLVHHVTKLRVGRDALTIQAFVADWVEPCDPGSPEELEISRRLDKALAGALERAPHDAHRARMRSLFVDFDDGMWNRPADTELSDAYLMVSAAAIQYDVYRTEFVRPENAFVAETIRRPGFPVPPEAPQIDHPW